MQSDSHLLLDFADHGSQDAFRQLVERHLPLVYRSALRQLNSDTHRAQDVAQMVFTALAQQARPLATHPNVCAWLYATTHRIACQTIRTEMRRRKREEIWTRDAELADRDDTSAWSALAPMLDEAIRGLGAAERDALVLHFFSNRSFAEVGEALRIGEDAARMRVNRALEKLRARFTASGLAVTPTSLAGLLASDTALGAPASLVTMIAAGAAQVVPVLMLGLVVFFMATTKVIPVAAAVAAILAVGVATRQWSVARSRTIERQSAQEEATSLRANMSAAERPVARTSSILTGLAVPAAPIEDPSLAVRGKGAVPRQAANDEKMPQLLSRVDSREAALYHLRRILDQLSTASLTSEEVPVIEVVKEEELTPSELARFQARDISEKKRHIAVRIDGVLLFKQVMPFPIDELIPDSVLAFLTDEDLARFQTEMLVSTIERRAAAMRRAKTRK